VRLLIFLLCLLAGTAALLVAAGGWRGRGPSEAPPTLPRAEAPAEGTLVPLESASGGAGALRLRTVGAPRYAMPEPFVYRDAATGARIEIPHFLPWSFSARGARAVLAEKADGGSILFEDVTVVTFRPPQTLAEALRLRDDPRAIEDFVRLEIYAPRARADGIARALQESAEDGSAPRDSAIVLDGGVEARDRRMEVLARGEALTFDPKTHLTKGQGRFVVEHAAWTLEGEGFTLSPDVREGRPSFDAAFRLEIASQVLLAVRENVLDAEGEAVWRAEDFRPSRVFAGRAGVVHDGSAPGSALHIALEQGVRALQQGGRRLLCDRLTLALEPRSAGKDVTARSWRLAHLVGEGRPLRIEVPDLEGSPGSKAAGGSGGMGAAQISARRLRHEPAAHGPSTTVLEGEPVVLFEGELSLTGVSAPGRWIRASASDRAVLGPAPGVAIDPATGAPVLGRRVELRGRARLERRDGSGGPDAESHDVLEGDEVSLVLRPARPEDGPGARDVPQSFAALGHVVLSGTRIEGVMERVVVEGLDTLEPRLVVEGSGTRLAFVGFGRGQRLLGEDPAPSTQDGAAAPTVDERRTWTLDRLDARGPVAGETRLGGPTVGVSAWIDGAHVSYDRLSDRALLVGSAGAPALVQLEADATHRHALSAPRIAFERSRARVRAEDGSRAEVYLQQKTGAALSGGLAGTSPQRGDAQRMELFTDGRIEVLLRVSRPGGEPAPEAAQVVRVLSPFTAEMRAPPPEAVDRLRAQSLEAVLALRALVETGSPTAGLARAGTRRALPGTATPDAGPAPTQPTVLERWLLTSRSLTLDVSEGTLGALEADGQVALESSSLQVDAATLRFSRALGSLWLEGGDGNISARMGPKDDAHSRFVARALRVAIDAEGPRWLLASGPTQAMLLHEDPKEPGRVERYEVDCPGDVRITDTELLAEARTTWVRRSLRPAAGAAFGQASDIWADRIQVEGKGLLRSGGAPASEAVRRVSASGPRTAFRSGEGSRRVDMWCEQIDVDVATGRAVLTGAPGQDVLVHFESGYDVELVRASFDFRTGEVEDLEAGRAVLRRGR
jgi:hypothetical protein